jgi:hypothetical protein
MPLRDILRPIGLVLLSALLIGLSKSAGVAWIDEFLSPLFAAIAVVLLVHAVIYVMSKIQFGLSMSRYAAKAMETATGAAIVFASVVAFMIALMALFVLLGLLS